MAGYGTKRAMARGSHRNGPWRHQDKMNTFIRTKQNNKEENCLSLIAILIRNL